MSRVGKYPVPVPAGVTPALAGRTLTAKGKLGELKLDLTDEVDIEIKDSEVAVGPRRMDRRGRTMWGTTRSLINSMVTGVSAGFSKSMEINGTGYRAVPLESDKRMHIGYICRSGSTLSRLAQLYIEELKKCSMNILPEGSCL